MNKPFARITRSLSRWLLVLMTPVALLSLTGPAAAAGTSARVLAGQSVQIPQQERTGLDKFTAVAAIASIVIVGVAGVYIYRLIKKGL